MYNMGMVMRSEEMIIEQWEGKEELLKYSNWWFFNLGLIVLYNLIVNVQYLNIEEYNF